METPIQTSPTIAQGAKKRLTVKSLGWSLLRVLACLLIGVNILIYFMQDKLLFFPERMSEYHAKDMLKGHPKAREVRLTAPDGVRLHGWFVGAPGRGKHPLIIFYGGNGEEDSGMLDVTPNCPHCSWAIMNYRGYGLSQGTPGEKALDADALLLYDTFTRRPDVDPARVVVLGRSLGTGIAVHVARRRPVCAVILMTPYDSIRSLGQEKFPFILSWLVVKHPFNAINDAPAINKPLLALIARDDAIIPPPHAFRLLGKWAGPVRAEVSPTSTHDSVEISEHSWQAINEFLRARL